MEQQSERDLEPEGQLSRSGSVPDLDNLLSLWETNLK